MQLPSPTTEKLPSRVTVQLCSYHLLQQKTPTYNNSTPHILYNCEATTTYNRTTPNSTNSTPPISYRSTTYISSNNTATISNYCPPSIIIIIHSNNTGLIPTWQLDALHKKYTKCIPHLKQLPSHQHKQVHSSYLKNFPATSSNICAVHMSNNCVVPISNNCPASISKTVHPPSETTVQLPPQTTTLLSSQTTIQPPSQTEKLPS